MRASDPFGWLGSIIDDQFAVESVAGEGSFGVVYRATHLGLDVPVAVKCLKVPPGLPESERPALLATFRGEARLLHQLSRRSSGIVQALAVGAATSPSRVWAPYIVMEWLEGETLEQDLRRRSAGELPRRTLDEALDLLGTAASALAIAHEEGVTHRDVKPGNLFLTPSRRGPLLKLVDFGIAKVLDDGGAGTARTDGDRKFTARYAAPEQFMPEYGATGPWTDVFALALILIEAVTGRFALRGETFVQIFASSIDARNRPSLTGRGASAPPELEAALAKALSVQPAERYRDAGEMWRAIEAARRPREAAPEPIPAREVGTSTLSLPPDAPPALTGERRVCTVMAIDVSSARELVARLDPEEVQAIVQRTLRAVTEQIAAMEGSSLPLGSDRVLAVFGWPRASDDDPERAVLAALRIQDALRSLPLPRAARSEPLVARIGVASGRIFTGTTGGAPMWIGEAVNQATELQKSAPPGAIVVGRATFRRVAGAFLVAPLATSGEGTIEAYRVSGVAPFRRGAASHDFQGAPTKLVGRTAEVQTLLDAYESTLDGSETSSGARSRLVTIVGGPGAGRSRLLADLGARIRERGDAALVVEAQASSLARDTSYGFAASVLQQHLGVREGDDAEDARRRLRAVARLLRARAIGDLGPGGPGEGGDLALAPIAGLLAAERAWTRLGGSILLDENSQHARHRLSAAVAELLDRVAARAPVVLLCDDLHWADEASLDLLHYLVERASPRGLFVVATARPELFERRPRWGEGSESFERVQLGPLPRRHVEEMARDRLRRATSASAESGTRSPVENLVRLVADRAEGSPLIMVETLHLLVDAGVIEPREGEAWAIHEDRLGELSVPPTIQGIVQARLDRLSPDAREALARAAVLGKTFWRGALERLFRVGGGSEPDAPIEEILAELRAKRIVLERETSSLPGEREHVFAEAALQEVAYETLARKTRRALHLAAAEWLAARGQGGALSAQLAFHFDRGGDPGRAALAHARAASHATSLGGHDEALRHLTRARELQEATREGDVEETGAERRVISWRERVRVRIELADVLRRAGRLGEAEPMYEEARGAILREERRLGSPYNPAEAARWDARVDYRLGLLHKIRGELSTAIEITERAIARATEGGALEEVPAMCALLAFAHRRSRRPEQSRAAARKGLRVCRSLPRRGEKWRDDIAQLLFGIGASRYAERRFKSAERAYRQAFRMISEAEAPHLAGIALNGIAVSRVEQGDLRGTREMLLRSLRAKERAGDLHQIAIAYSNLADVELRLGDDRAALAHSRSAVRVGEQSRAGSDLSDMYRNLADASARTGDLDGALTAGARALAIGARSGRVYLAEIIESLVRILSDAHARSSAGDALRGRVDEGRRALLAVIEAHASESDMAPRAAGWRERLSAIAPDTVARLPSHRS